MSNELGQVGSHVVVFFSMQHAYINVCSQVCVVLDFMLSSLVHQENNVNGDA